MQLLLYLSNCLHLNPWGFAFSPFISLPISLGRSEQTAVCCGADCWVKLQQCFPRNILCVLERFKSGHHSTPGTGRNTCSALTQVWILELPKSAPSPRFLAQLGNEIGCRNTFPGLPIEEQVISGHKGITYHGPNCLPFLATTSTMCFTHLLRKYCLHYCGYCLAQI